MDDNDRLNLAKTGWAGGWRNVSFIAGRLLREKSKPGMFMIQQTPVVMQSIPFLADPPQPDRFTSGSYVSVYARIRGRTRLDENQQPVDSIVAPTHLHTRFANGREMDPDRAQKMLMEAVMRAPKDAKVDMSLKGMILDTPDEIKGMQAQPLSQTPPGEALQAEDTADDDPYALNKRDNQLIRNGNHVQISGVIGYMEFRDGGDDPSQNRATIYVQQNASLAEAIPVRIYGKQAMHVVDVYSPGHVVFVSGNLHVDVKKDADGKLRTTPFVKTFSVEPAQATHIKFTKGGMAFPEWAVELYRACNGNSAESKAEAGKRMRMVKAESREKRMARREQAGTVGDGDGNGATSE